MTRRRSTYIKSESGDVTVVQIILVLLGSTLLALLAASAIWAMVASVTV